jgi:isoleucyl-tRNA synthetase
MDQLYRDLNLATGRYPDDSVHLAPFTAYDEKLIDKGLEERMDIAQKISSMILGLRRKVSIRVRQPLAKIMLPLPDKTFRKKFEAVKDLVLSEVNVKEVEYIDDTASMLIRKIKPNFKTLGPKYGKLMKEIAAAVSAMTQQDIASFEKAGTFIIEAAGQKAELTSADAEIISEDIPGWLVANEGKLTVALDITVTDELRHEGIAREFVNRIQNIRKENGYDVTDKIIVQIEALDFVKEAVRKHSAYIASQTLATGVDLVSSFSGGVKEVDIDEVLVKVAVMKD